MFFCSSTINQPYMSAIIPSYSGACIPALQCSDTAASLFMSLSYFVAAFSDPTPVFRMIRRNKSVPNFVSLLSYSQPSNPDSESESDWDSNSEAIFDDSATASRNAAEDGSSIPGPFLGASPIYEPLPKGKFFRVLKLQPGDAKGEIDCSLEIRNFETCTGAYEAISYVWGDSANTVEVRCNGLRVSITNSLARALKNFRRRHEHRMLWVDTLCINQKDDREKGHQVRMMGQVYANAKTVLVWLGDDYRNVAADTFALIRDTNNYFGGLFLKHRGRYSDMPPLREPYPICVKQKKWRGVSTLFDFPWFRRVWTVQEVAIAKECRMFWGSASIDIADVVEICVWFDRRDDFYNIVKRLTRRVRHLSSTNIQLYSHYDTYHAEAWQRSRTGLEDLAASMREKSFLTVLKAARKLKATDPRDHVYAFLGCPCAKGGDEETLIKADYVISGNGLYIDLACALLQNPSDGPWVLSSVQHKHRKDIENGDLPSWVPIWHVKPTHLPVADTRHWYKTGGCQTRFSLSISTSNTVSVGGFVFDKIIWMTPIISRVYSFGLENSPWNAAESRYDQPLIDGMWEIVLESATKHRKPVQEDDYTRTLMRGYAGCQHVDEVTDRAHHGYLKVYKKGIRLSQSDMLGTEVMTASEKLCATRFEHELLLIRNSRLFLTEHGRLGLVSRGEVVEVGDDCCIVFGSTVPFILTPQEDGRHKLVSECYIHGVMNGELMGQFNESNLNDHYIILE
jgi:hypothetical protein